MSAGCVRWVLYRAVGALCGGSPGYWTPASTFTICSERSAITAPSWRRSPFCTAAGDTEQTPPTRKKQKARSTATVSAVGRKIPQRQIHVISESGESLGTMHRANVIKIMDEKGLKLVLVSENQDPPVYQLMSGKQIHEEQLKLREKQKAKAAVVQVKELTFSSSIAANDRTTKLKKVESWLEKKHHVKITLQSGRGECAVNLDSTLEQMVQEMGVMVGFVNKPQVIRDGRAAVCILRPPSAKELSEKEKKKATESPSADSSLKDTQNKADTADESLQP